jgi:hypothetical protein
MLTPSSDVQARLSALEEYIEMPAERTGMAVTARLKAQHNLLVALRAELTEFRAEFTNLRAEFHVFRDQTNQRLTALEDMLGQVLHGMTDIKRMLAPGGSP